MNNFFLGLDCSTQSFTAVIMDFNLGKVIYQYSLDFEKDLAHYNTQDGVVILGDESIVHSYPLMWIDGLELERAFYIEFNNRILKKSQSKKLIINKMKS